jgi:hypothetical protein
MAEYTYTTTRNIHGNIIRDAENSADIDRSKIVMMEQIDNTNIKFTTNSELTTLEQNTLIAILALTQNDDVVPLVRDETVYSSTSTTYVEKYTYTTENIVAGDYRIRFSWLLSSDKKASPVGARCQIDDTTTLFETYRRMPYADEFDSQGSTSEITLVAGVHTIDVDILSGSGSGRGVNIRDIYIEIEEI